MSVLNWTCSSFVIISEDHVWKKCGPWIVHAEQDWEMCSWDIQGTCHHPGSSRDLNQGVVWEASATVCLSPHTEGSPPSQSAAAPAVTIAYLRRVTLAAQSREWVSPFAVAHPEGDSVSHPELTHLPQLPLPSSLASAEASASSVPGDADERAPTYLQTCHCWGCVACLHYCHKVSAKRDVSLCVYI